MHATAIFRHQTPRESADGQNMDAALIRTVLQAEGYFDLRVLGRGVDADSLELEVALQMHVLKHRFREHDLANRPL
jgi:hypothetical protein